MKNKIVAIQGDNFKKLNYNNDTTVFLALEAQKQGSKIFFGVSQNLEDNLFSIKILSSYGVENSALFFFSSS